MKWLLFWFFIVTVTIAHKNEEWVHNNSDSKHCALWQAEIVREDSEDNDLSCCIKTWILGILKESGSPGLKNYVLNSIFFFKIIYFFNYLFRKHNSHRENNGRKDQVLWSWFNWQGITGRSF